MKRFLFIVFIVSTVFNVKAQLLEWNFLSNVKGNERASISTDTDPNMEVSILSRGPGIKAQRATYSFASAFPINPTKEDGIKAGSYYQFTVRSKKGYKVSLQAIDVVLRIQKEAPKNYRWMYSTDGENFVGLGEEDITSAPTINNGVPQPTVDLSTYKALQNVPSSTTVTFRLYAWGGTDGSANNGFRIGKSDANRSALSVKGKTAKEK